MVAMFRVDGVCESLRLYSDGKIKDSQGTLLGQISAQDAIAAAAILQKIREEHGITKLEEAANVILEYIPPQNRDALRERIMNAEAGPACIS